MINSTKIIIPVFTTLLLVTSCANQNQIAQQNLAPVSNPCQKLDYLIKAYDDGFEQLKAGEVKARASKIWQAKYHLIGENCTIWTLGGDKTTYSCNTVQVDEQVAKDYYNKAVTTVKQCLGSEWQVNSSKRRHDDGSKTLFSTGKSEVTVSTHLVPSSSVYSNTWSVYYYVGKNQ